MRARRSDGGTSEGQRFQVVETADGFAVVDHEPGELVAYATELRAFGLARLLNTLDPDAAQLAALLGDGRGSRLLRTIELRHESVCHRCGGRLRAGSRARWNPYTRLARHPRSCPKPHAAKRRQPT